MTSLFNAPIIEPPNEGPHFDGATYDPEFDFSRLNGQLERVWRYMSDGRWHTIEEIAGAVNATPQATSARIRDLRKKKFGSYRVDRSRNEGGKGFVYRLNGGKGDGEPESRTCVHCATAFESIDREIRETINDYFVNPNSQSSGKLDGLEFAKQQLEREHKHG